MPPKRKQLQPSEYSFALRPRPRWLGEFKRVAWAEDLRTLGHFLNSPGAHESLLTLRQAGTDSDIERFVLVLESSADGYLPLEQLFLRLL